MAFFNRQLAGQSQFVLAQPHASLLATAADDPVSATVKKYPTSPKKQHRRAIELPPAPYWADERLKGRLAAFTMRRLTPALSHPSSSHHWTCREPFSFCCCSGRRRRRCGPGKWTTLFTSKPTSGRSSRPTAGSATAKKRSSKAALDARTARLLLKGGDSGPAIVAGRPRREPAVSSESPPARCRRATRNCSMPQIDTLARWIDAGAKTLRDEPEHAARRRHVYGRRTRALVVSADPPARRCRRCAKPAVGRTPIDAFLLARLEVARAELWPGGRSRDVDPPLVAST